MTRLFYFIVTSILIFTISSALASPIGARVYTSDDVRLENSITYDKKLNTPISGIYKAYYASGALEGEVPFKDGKPNGTAKQYYESGTVHDITTFKDGLRNGVYKGYYESGVLGQTSPFRNGKLDGTVKRYYESGVLKKEMPFKDGELNGTLKEYSESGILEKEVLFKSDKAVAGYHYDKNANKTKMTQDELQNR